MPWEILVSIPTKLNTRITNITFIFDEIHPWRWNEDGMHENKNTNKVDTKSNVLVHTRQF